jgi:ferric-dicitrate binding protein FerR (iron transport regulator)
MKLDNCSEVDRALWQYVDRELSAAELALLSAHLKECQRCRDLYHERAREANLYRTVLMGAPFGEAFVEKLRGRMQREGLLQGEWREPRALPRGQRLAGDASGAASDGDAVLHARRRSWRRLAVLAMVLVIPVAVITGVLLQRNGARVLGSFEVEDGSVAVSVQDAEGVWSSLPGHVSQGELLAGSCFRVPESVRVVLTLQAADPARGASRLALDGPAELAVDAGASRSDLVAVLKKGGLHATVSKRLPGESFVILTPQARATVVGTEFRLDVDAERTRLRVLEGEVRFGARGDPLPRPEAVGVTERTGAFYVERGMTAPAALETATVTAPPRSEPEAMLPPPTEPGPAPEATPPAASGAGAHLDTPVSGAER